jgi:hypothetical protein
MSLLINLTPSEEDQLSAAATQTGLAPEAYATQLVREHLPAVNPIEEMGRQLSQWQQQDKTPQSQPALPQHCLKPTAALFELWAKRMPSGKRQV